VVIGLDGFRARFRELHAGFFGELLDRFHEGETLGLHDEIDDVAAGAGGEAFEDALLVVDVEAGCLLVGEGRQADPLLALLGKFDLPADHVGGADAGFQLLHEAVRDADCLRHASMVPLSVLRGNAANHPFQKESGQKEPGP
jgi:hypothetical protein